MLTQLLTEEVISIEAGARDWRHAIELATAPAGQRHHRALLCGGALPLHEELGPYYVLGRAWPCPTPARKTGSTGWDWR